MFSKGSVNGSRYTVIDTATTFYAGQERCQQLGGHLAHINSLREQLFLEDFVQQLLQTTQQQGSENFSLCSVLVYLYRQVVFCLSLFVCLLLSLSAKLLKYSITQRNFTHITQMCDLN